MTTRMLIAHVFKRRNTYRYLISSAISEGIKDTFKEMGYKYDKGSAKEKKERQSKIDSSELIMPLNDQKNEELFFTISDNHKGRGPIEPE